MKRILLFVGTNILVMVVVSIIISLLGIDQSMSSGMSGLLFICLLWGMIGSFISLSISRWIAKRSMNLQEIDADGPFGYINDMVAKFAHTANIEMPEVYWYDSDELNAFATGPSKNKSLVAVSRGLLEDFNRDEVEGVIGHEVAHIANGDMVTMALVQGVVNAFVMFLARVVAFAIDQALRSDDEGEGLGYFAYFALVTVLQIVFGILTAPLVAWFSRQREYRADEGGAHLAGTQKMIAALKALEDHMSVSRLDTSEPSLQTMKISGKGTSIFSTHPALSDRIQALENLK